MKFALALLALVATTSAFEIPNFGRGELHKDIQEFINLMPVDQIVSITLQYLGEDKEFQDFVKYLKSADFKKLAADVQALPEILKLMNYIHHAGIDIYKMVNKMNEMIGLPKLTPPSTFVNGQIKGGMKGYADDIIAILPVEKLQKLFETKLTTSKAFAEFIDQLKSENFQKIVNEVYKNAEFQKLLKKAKDRGFNLEIIKDLLLAILGIKVPSKPVYYMDY